MYNRTFAGRADRLSPGIRLDSNFKAGLSKLSDRARV
jgi:hypothetical protein